MWNRVGCGDYTGNGRRFGVSGHCSRDVGGGMYMVDPRLVSEASGEPVHSVGGRRACGQVSFPDQRAENSV